MLLEKTITNAELDQVIIDNHKTKTLKEIAIECGVSSAKASANYTWLVRKGTIIAERKSKVAKVISKVEKINKQIAKVTTNTYHNQTGSNKEVARVKMANTMIESGVVGVVPTLSHVECAIEQKVLSVVPSMEFLAVERDSETYRLQRQYIRHQQLPIKTYFGSISDKLFGQMEDTYAHLVLDYCGMLPTFAKELEYSIQHNIVKVGGTICMTFAKPIRGNGGMFDKIKALGGTITNNVDDNRCMSDRATEAYFNKVTGWNYELVEMFNYMDTYPMTLVVLKRIK
jgi:hypothetical protein